MEIDGKIRLGVIKSLPEAKEIKNKELRERVYDAWAISLASNGYKRLEDMPPKGVWDVPPLKSGTQADHFRGVTRLCIAIAKELKDNFADFDVDMDELIAGALCHDLGKPFEFNPSNLERWKADPRKTGPRSPAEELRPPARGRRRPGRRDRAESPAHTARCWSS